MWQDTVMGAAVTVSAVGLIAAAAVAATSRWPWLAAFPVAVLVLILVVLYWYVHSDTGMRAKD